MVRIARFEYYKNPKDEVYFRDFLNSITFDEKRKLIEVIRKIEALGLGVAQRQLWIKKIENNLFEVRSKFGSNIQRAPYFKPNKHDYFVITHGFSKKTDKMPEREKARARRIRRKFEEDGGFIEQIS